MRLTYPILCLLSTASVQATLIEYDGFDYPVSSSEPAGWVSDGDSDHASVEAGSLSFPDYAASTGNQMALQNKTADYLHSFAATDLAVGETVYFSLLMQIDSVADFGSQFNVVFRLYDAADPNGSAVSVGMGSSTSGSNTFGFSVDNRNRGWGHTDAVTGPEVYAFGETHLVVGAYTRGASSGDGEVKLWIDPSSSSFGGAEPAVSLSEASYQSDAVWDTFEIASSGSSSLPSDWSVDEFRVGTDWASVVPATIPEPSTYALLLGVGVALMAYRRRTQR
ncbi:PEP-CTERM sorting domain-containing protein [Cerasicoccus maritimus]|uniref:PEP-CTERM sorting domain-containing protein n=1 Tax=Cerasicoccus maritimus TaxID=490089 RepID=UPI002852D5EC|nr:PEP-CTERM sorting domain-containing protein [Cerasicoccus maritimus]